MTDSDRLEEIAREQRRTNELLLMLIDAMAEDNGEGAPAARYLDGGRK